MAPSHIATRNTKTKIRHESKKSPSNLNQHTTVSKNNSKIAKIVVTIFPSFFSERR